MNLGWVELDVEPGLGTLFNHPTLQPSQEAHTLTLSRICSLLASMSPLYTMLITPGSFRCRAAMAVHSTRSPPPPALLSFS